MALHMGAIQAGTVKRIKVELTIAALKHALLVATILRSMA